MLRKLIEINQELCDGCGQCILSCAEGALALVEGKAALVSDSYCDGLGACLGECPAGALTIVEREAVPVPDRAAGTPSACPGSRPQVLKTHPPGRIASNQASQLGQWPVKLDLVPVQAPYFQDSDLLVTADCLPFTYAGFHQDFLAGRSLVTACPKLGDTSLSLQKLTAIITANPLKGITVLYMEVPCCSSLLALTKRALVQSGRKVALEGIKLSLEGTILNRVS